MVVFEYFEHK